MANNFKISELQALNRDLQANDRFILNDTQDITQQNTRYINYSDLKDAIAGNVTTGGGDAAMPPTIINWNGSRKRKGSSVTWPAGMVADTQWDADSTKVRRSAVPLTYNPPADADRVHVTMWFYYFIDVLSLSNLTLQVRNRLLIEAPGVQGLADMSTSGNIHPGWTNGNGKISMQVRMDSLLYDVPARQLYNQTVKQGVFKIPKGTSSINLYNSMSVLDQAMGPIDEFNVGLLTCTFQPFDSTKTQHPNGIATSFGAFAGTFDTDDDGETGIISDEQSAYTFSDAIKRRMKKDLDLITQFESEFPNLAPYRQAILDFRTDGSQYVPEVAHEVYMTTISSPIYEIIKFDFDWAPSVRDSVSLEYTTPRSEF